MLNETLPKPSKLLIVVSVLNIAVCLYLVSETFARIYISSTETYPPTFIHADPFTFWTGIFLGAYWIVISVQQYRGTFRRVPSAAKMCSLMLYAASVLIALFLALRIGLEVSTGNFTVFVRFASPFIIILLPLLIAARLNANWGRKISTDLAYGVAIQNRRKYSLRELFLAVGVIAVMCGVAARRIHSVLPDYADIPWHAEHVDISAVPFGLPADATDISYSQGYRGKLVYEFTVDESSFRDWAGAIGSSMSDTPSGISLFGIVAPDTFEIGRYTALISYHQGPWSVAISDGLGFHHWDENESVTVAYDRDTGRAYYSKDW